MNDAYTVEEKGQITRVVIDLKEMTFFNSAKLRQALELEIADETEHFIVDLSGVEYVDSTGLGAFVSLNKRLNDGNKNLYLVSITDSLETLLRVTRLDRTIKSFESIEKVLQHIESGV